MNLQKIIKVIFAILPSIAAGITVTVFVTTVSNLLWDTKDKPDYNKTFFDYLDKGLNDGKFTKDYLEIGFNHFDRKSSGAFSKNGYVETIEDYVVHIETNESLANKSNDNKIVYDLLSKAKETEPFSSLPPEERRLMDNIQTFMANNDTANATNALNQLKQVILAKSQEYKKIDEQNAWSMPLAITGALLTVIFGVWSVWLSIRFAKRDIQQG